MTRIANPRLAIVGLACLLATGLIWTSCRWLGIDDAQREPVATIAHPSGIPSYPQAVLIGAIATDERAGGEARIQLCQCQGCASGACQGNCGTCQGQSPLLIGVDCLDGPCDREARWGDRRPIPWQALGQGEYVGPARIEHVPVYRLRVDDDLEFVYRLTRKHPGTPYELNEGDQVSIESLTDEKVNRTDVTIQPDGMITVKLLGQVRAARRTIEELRAELEEKYKKYYVVPGITVTPTKMNTRLEDLRDAVDSRFGSGGLSRVATVTPAGQIQLPGIPFVHAQGLTLEELKREIDLAYDRSVPGIEVTPVLTERAPRFVYVVGEVQTPGRYEMVGPTTVMQAIALGGGWNNGGNLREIVVFRRAEDWRLIATRVDIQGALYARRPCPADEIWLRDSDIVVVPKSFLLLADDFIDLIFTRGIYGVMPFQGVSLNFSKASTL